VNLLKIPFLLLKFALLNLLLSLKIKEKNLRRKLTMAKKKNEEKPGLSPNKEQKTKPLEEKVSKEEEKPSFKSLLSKGKESASSTESSLPGSEGELDENMVEVCADVIAIPFAIWHELNDKVQPLSEKEKQNISKPLAKIVAKYDLGKYMKEEFVLFFYLGSAIYGRTKIPKARKHDKDDNRKEGQGQDELDTRINPECTS